VSFEIRFAVEAEETYDSIVSQLRERWGDKFVIKLENKISQSLKLIAEEPFIYPEAQENTKVRKCILHKNCSLFYSVNIDYVEIIYFWDNRQDPLIY
jgi:plasmid stabilization system protein ParE